MTKEQHLDIKVGKKQVLLCNTGRNFKDYMKGLTYRRNGKYEKVPNYIIDKRGEVYEMGTEDVTSLYLTGYHNDYEDGVVVISLENNGWLRRRSSDGKYVNWLGDIYSSKVFEKKWRNKLFWDEYTDEQMKSAVKLVEKVCKEYDIPNEFIGHNVLVDGVEHFEGVVSRSNYNEYWMDINPSFKFELLCEKEH